MTLGSPQHGKNAADPMAGNLNALSSKFYWIEQASVQCVEASRVDA